MKDVSYGSIAVVWECKARSMNSLLGEMRTVSVLVARLFEPTSSNGEIWKGGEEIQNALDKIYGEVTSW